MTTKRNRHGWITPDNADAAQQVLKRWKLESANDETIDIRNYR